MKQVYLSNEEYFCKASWIPEEIIVQYPYTEIIPPVELKQPKFNWKNGEWEETYNKSIVEQNEQLKKELKKANDHLIKTELDLSSAKIKISELQETKVQLEKQADLTSQSVMEILDFVLQSKK